MTETVKAKASHRFAASPERVYDAWLDPAKLRAWMKAALTQMGTTGDIRRIEIDARVGGKFFFSDMREAGEAKHWGTYRVLDRPRKIEFTWIVDESQDEEASIVTIMIVPDGTGCEVTIEHEMSAEWAAYVERTEAGWSNMMRALDGVLGSATA
jgi:uncharacterized protein YndB with AHSA1/START domain